MRIACLVTVCGLLPIITVNGGEQLLGLNATSVEDAVTSTELSCNSSISPIDMHSETEVRRTTRSVRETSTTPYYFQASNRRMFEGKPSRRGKLKRVGNSVGANEVYGDKSVPEVEESKEIHLEPIQRSTKKSAIESIVDLIRSVVEPAKNQLGPLIGPVRFPGVGEKVYIRLPEPVENESNHVVVRLLSRPVVHSGSGHSRLPAGEQSVESSNRHQSTHLPASTTIATNRHHGLHHRHVPSTALPEITGNELDSQGVSSDKDRSGISSPSIQTGHRQDTAKISLNDRRLIAEKISPGRNHRYDDIDSTSRMSRVHPMSKRLRNPHYFPRNTRGYNGHRFLGNVNPQWTVRGRGNYQQQWPGPMRERQLMSRSYPGPGKNTMSRNRAGYFTANMKSRPIPRYSPLEVKDNSNEWRGIVVNYRNDLWPRQRSYAPVNDFQYPDASSSSSTNPVTKFHWQTRRNNLTTSFNRNEESALNVITAPPLQYFRPFRNMTNSAMNFSQNVLNDLAKKSNDEVRKVGDFRITVVPTTNKLVIKSDETRAPKTHILRLDPKSLKFKNRVNVEETEDASKYESLENVLRFDDVRNTSKSANLLDGSEETSVSDEVDEDYDEPDDSSVEETIANESHVASEDYRAQALKAMESELNADEYEESSEDSHTTSTERTKIAYKSKAVPTKNPTTGRKLSKTSKNDVLFNIMTMTASQSWNEQPSNSKSKSVLGILKIRNGGKNVVAKVPGTPDRPRNHQLLDFPNSDESMEIPTENRSSKNTENYTCGNSEEDDLDKSCEYDTDSTPELSYEEE